MQFRIEFLKNLGEERPIVISKLRGDMAPEHQNLLSGLEHAPLEDERKAKQYWIGEANEEGLIERWQDFESRYLAQSRITRFWHTTLHDAVVLKPYGIVVVGDLIIKDTVRNVSTLYASFPEADREQINLALRHPGERFEASLGDVTEVGKPAYQLGYGVSENFFNWTLRYLSRVRMYQQQDAARRLIVPDTRNGYIPRGLEFFGVSQREVVSLKSGSVRVPRLELSSPSAIGRYELAPFIVGNLRHHPAVGQLWRRSSRKLYIPRRNVKFRRVVNEDAVEALLVAQGFTVFDAGLMPFHEQVARFRSAELIVAPHGAGLSNIVYCEPGTKVLEMIPVGYDQGVTSYRSLADLFGLQYHSMFATEAEVDPKGNRCNSSIHIPLVDLERALALL